MRTVVSNADKIVRRVIRLLPIVCFGDYIVRRMIGSFAGHSKRAAARAWRLGFFGLLNCVTVRASIAPSTREDTCDTLGAGPRWLPSAEGTTKCAKSPAWCA